MYCLHNDRYHQTKYKCCMVWWNSRQDVGSSFKYWNGVDKALLIISRMYKCSWTAFCRPDTPFKIEIGIFYNLRPFKNLYDKTTLCCLAITPNGKLGQGFTGSVLIAEKLINTLRQSECHYTDNIVNYISLNFVENVIEKCSLGSN